MSMVRAVMGSLISLTVPPGLAGKKKQKFFSMAMIPSTDRKFTVVQGSFILVSDSQCQPLPAALPSTSSLFCTITTAVNQGNAGPVFLRLQDPPTEGYFSI